MAKSSIRYICSSCGAESLSWAGKCFVCGEWNTLVEESVKEFNKNTTKSNKLIIKDVDKATKSNHHRISTKLLDLDKLFGGGLVKGSVLLVAGEPGIGKSTLLLQMCGSMSQEHDVLYVSGEESVNQVGMRAKRLNINYNKLKLTNSTVADDIASEVANGKYSLVVVDSIQTLRCSEVNSSAGSVSQISSSTHLLLSASKQSGCVLIIVGHVTKEGSIAGPKILEHIVDGVFQLEGDRYGGYKILRSVKNRYGSTNESVVFEMQDYGLQVVENPSKALLSQRQDVDGSIILATIEGSRAILVEVQALVNSSVYGYPKRTASGFDINRLNLLVAVLQRRTKLNLADKDIYINIVGGIKIAEPAADLAVCMAIGSATKKLKLNKNLAVFGEVGLTGEVRHVPFLEKRIEEAMQMGLSGVICPKISSKKLKSSNVFEVSDVKQALNTFLK
jgi:DNA repair protein RadA/Sms